MGLNVFQSLRKGVSGQQPLPHVPAFKDLYEAGVTPRQGQVVMVGSYAALRPAPSQAAYAASKAALAGLVKSLAREWGKDGIRVNLVLPGFMLTEMTAVLRESVKEAALSRHVLNRLNTPEQAAAFILFLQDVLTAASGQVFDLDSRIV